MVARIHLKAGLVGLALAVLMTGSLAGAQGSPPDCFILSCGVDKYQNAKSLHGCVQDAFNIVKPLKNQKGKLFGRVEWKIYVDGQGTRERLDQGLEWLGGAGKAGDFLILFLSGHGGRRNGTWYFLPHNYDSKSHLATSLGDVALLKLADVLASQGKKVFLIVDACFAGQIRHSGRDMLNRRYPHGGGVILMVSSMPGQLSTAMGQFSAFAKSVAEALAGEADLNDDGEVTLREVRRFAYHRVNDLLGQNTKQDGECDYSLSISEDLPLALARRTPPPDLAGTEWVGKEALANFGKLRFKFLPNHQVAMSDTRGATKGTWSQVGHQVRIRFEDGQVVYSGSINAGVLSGTASGHQGNTWTWLVLPAKVVSPGPVAVLSIPTRQDLAESKRERSSRPDFNREIRPAIDNED